MDYNASAIGDVLFTKTQQRVLGLLFGQPERSFYLNEITLLVDMGRGTVRRELQKLHSVGLVTLSKHGNQNHYQANSNNPIFSELKAVINKTIGVVGVLRVGLEPLFDQLNFALIYGSIAKATEHANSDIDLMLVGDNLSYTEVMDNLLAAEAQLGRSINPTLYTAEEFDTRMRQSKDSFVSRVFSNSTLWLKGKEQFYSQYTISIG